MNSEVISKNCIHCGEAHQLDSLYCCQGCEAIHSKNFQSLQVQKSKFSYLDHSDVNQYYIDQKRKVIRFQVEGLHCSSCVHLLEQIPKYTQNCIGSRVFFGESTLEIEFQNSDQISEIAEVIEEMGYKPQPLKVHTNVSEGLELKTDLNRLVVAGACASQIMIFSFAIYFGADGLIKDSFRVLSLLLFLPILFYSARPFYRGAWNSLKHRMMHIDLPIVIALWSTTAFSIWHFVNGSDEFYFDSTAGFIFLILCARYLVKRTQKKLLSPEQMNKFFSNQIFQTSTGSFKAAEDLEVDQMVYLQSGQMVPADSILMSSAALFDTSMMNGESRPLYFAENLKLLAGYKLISQNAEIRIQKTLAESELAGLIKSSFNNLLQKNLYINKSDRLAQKLLTVVISVSILFFVIAAPVFGIEETVRRVLALLVVACPCALAFGSPLTLAMAFRKAQSMGITIRNPDIFEKLSRIKNIFFDKTGTLTEGQLKIVSTWPENLNLETKKLILDLEKKSIHPIAFAVRQAWQNEINQSPEVSKQNYAFTSLQENLGLGVIGHVDDHTFELKTLSDSIHDHQLAIGLFKDQEIQARVYFNDPLRQEARSIVSLLKKYDFDFFVLSGDRKKRTIQVSEKCGIAADHVFSELYPEDKEDLIKRYPASLMIGDGLNDTLALSKSDVGISMSTAHDLTIDSSDITFFRGGLEPLLDLFKIHRQTLSTLNRNLGLALAYNSVSGVCALAGLINPLAAAILMPVSTGLVVISCYWGLR